MGARPDVPIMETSWSDDIGDVFDDTEYPRVRADRPGNKGREEVGKRIRQLDRALALRAKPCLREHGDAL